MEKQLIHKRENLLFGVLVTVSVIVTILLVLSIIGGVFLFWFALIMVVTNGIANAYIRMNGVQLSERQFPELHEKVIDLCKRMAVWDVPEVYIMESGGMLNAFATKASALFGKNMVVLYSDLVELDYQEQPFDIDYILAHELAHIKRNHILKSILTLPARFIPFIGSAYSRSCEYTCDRMAAYYTEKPDNVINSLLVLASGKVLYSRVNVEEFLHQYNSKKGIFAALAELTSTHPSLPKRIEALEAFMYQAPSVQLIKRTGVLVAVVAVGVFASALFLITPTYLTLTWFEDLAEKGLFTGTDPEEDYYEFEYDFSADPNGEFMNAIYNEDLQVVEGMLLGGTNPNTMNIYGENPLTLAISNERYEMVPLLLEYGADPNMIDENDWTPLMMAVFNENIYICQLLLEYGADVNLADSTGQTAVDYAQINSFTEFLNIIGSN